MTVPGMEAAADNGSTRFRARLAGPNRGKRIPGSARTASSGCTGTLTKCQVKHGAGSDAAVSASYPRFQLMQAAASC